MRDEYLKRFYNHFREAGLTRLEEPLESDDFVYCSMETTLDNPDFVQLWFNTALTTLVKAVKRDHEGCYYLLNITEKDGVVTLRSTRQNSMDVLEKIS